MFNEIAAYRQLKAPGLAQAFQESVDLALIFASFFCDDANLHTSSSNKILLLGCVVLREILLKICRLIRLYVPVVETSHT